MNVLKKHLKMVLGIAVLILFGVVFFFTQRATDLENGNMKNWISASTDRRETAIRILAGTDEHNELMIQCIDKIASLPDSSEMAIRDAASLCYTGIQLKENI